MSTAVATPARKNATILHSVKPVQKTSAKTSKPGKVAKKQPKAKKTRAGALSDAERRNYVEVAAYYIAERRGFCGGNELEDWVQAEQEVDRILK